MLTTILILAALIVGGIVLGAVSETVTRALQNGGLNGPVSRAVTYSGPNASIDISYQVPASSTNAIQLVAFGYATLQIMYIVSSQAVRLSVNDLNGGSPLFEVSLTAGAPYLWTDDGYFTNPCGTTNVTTFHWGNNTLAANIVGEIVY